MVDPCTKNAHDKKEQTSSLGSSIETPISQLLVEPINKEYSMQSIIGNDDVLEGRIGDDDMLEERIDDDDMLEEQTFIFLPHKKKRTATFRHVAIPNKDNFENFDSDSDSSTEDDESEDDGNDRNRDHNETSNNFKDYSHPIFDIPEDSKLPKQD